MIPVVGVGAGGHAKVIIDILRQMGQYETVALTDPNPDLWGSQLCGVPIIGGDQLLASLVPRIRHAFLGVGSVRSNALRPRLFHKMRELDFQLVNAIHPKAVLSPDVKLGTGVAIMAGAILNPGVIIGNNVIANTGALIDHDCVIGDHTHVAPGVCLSGGVRVGENCHIGLAACVLQGVVVGDRATVGAGAVVIHDVAEDATVAGVPARPVRRATAGKDSSQALPDPRDVDHAG